ncbi:hypothetical protein FGE12_03180 [Aggregicoccus sp. 17bor-14]|uniref:hypothetical protein n=1 Tax=Myxococcaceae TaxID=31 RepID=UPI00129C34B1|nr:MULTISPECIES: hypothetical protein [Myxococcaceae]MBF5041376.1 hypothetical protein [Simulacricoccus sp. 17bor-14]MRI87160.1 hypothetical protein [Aggregicoccus sp. 17bor-14]
MPRTYSYDHFQVPKSLPKQQASLRDEDKQHLSEVTSVGNTGVHYGKSHAETEHILQARKMARQLEELAAPTLAGEEKLSRPAESRRSKKKAAAAAEKAASTGPTAPIGALPTLDEAPVAESPEGQGLWGVLDEGQRQLRALQGALGDARAAAGRLASLPLEAVREAARLAAQRLHLVHG